MIFSWKKKEDPSAALAQFKPQPAKAREWVTRGKGIAAQGNHGTALVYLAMGVRLDPGELTTHEAMWEAALGHHRAGGKPASKDEIRQIEGTSAIDKFAMAEFAWMRDVNSLDRAMEAMTAAVAAGQTSWGSWIATRVLNLVRAHMAKKPSKKVWVRAKDLFAELDAWNEALACGQEAIRIDPSDGELQSELNQLSAARAIQQGGYSQTANEEGGFRANVKDLDKQRALEEAESISGGADVETRNLERARVEHEANPSSPDAINRYAQLLRRRQTTEDEERAYVVYMDGFQRLNEYRFRMLAGDIRLSQARRAVAKAEEDAAAKSGDAALAQALAQARTALLELEAGEYGERAEKYPTDRAIKFEYGRVLFTLGRTEDAMASFQAAKDEGRFRVAAAHLLGRCFSAEGWHTEAVGEFREALQAIDATSVERELDIRYDLMNSLIAAAKAEHNVEMAREAADICSAILRKDIAFRDIRARRKELDALVKELS